MSAFFWVVGLIVLGVFTAEWLLLYFLTEDYIGPMSAGIVFVVSIQAELFLTYE